MRKVVRAVSAVFLAAALGSLGLPVWQARDDPVPGPLAESADNDPFEETLTMDPPAPSGRRVFARLSRCLAPELMPGGEINTRGVGRDAFAAAVARRVEHVRELEFDHRVQPSFVSPAELRQMLAREVTPALIKSVDLDLRILSTLGVVRETHIPARRLARGIAGFYDPSDERLVVGMSAASFGLVDDFVLAHELEHALADQNFGLPEGEFGFAKGDSDRALDGLIEGDAMLTAAVYYVSTWGDLRAATSNQAGYLSFLFSRNTSPLARITSFPYFEGMLFVCNLFVRGGWTAIDDAYVSPPTTTAQVLFPKRYRRGEVAIAPQSPGSLGSPWRMRRSQEFGAFDLLLLFTAPGGLRSNMLSNPLRQAAAWAGGELKLWTRRGAAAVGLALVQRGPGTELCDSMASWMRYFLGVSTVPTRRHEAYAANGALADGVLWCRGKQVRVAIAPSIEEARSLAYER